MQSRPAHRSVAPAATSRSIGSRKLQGPDRSEPPCA
jgi:hypothetical protein